MDLPGEVAWITGAVRGQGLSYAQALAPAGAQASLTDIAADLSDVTYQMPSPGNLDAAASQMLNKGYAAHAVTVGNPDSAQVDATAQKVCAQHGRLDILVANAVVCFSGIRVDDGPAVVNHDRHEPDRHLQQRSGR